MYGMSNILDTSEEYDLNVISVVTKNTHLNQMEIYVFDEVVVFNQPAIVEL